MTLHCDKHDFRLAEDVHYVCPLCAVELETRKVEALERIAEHLAAVRALLGSIDTIVGAIEENGK